jgi:membrane fusion protein (multidrug efflux system)
MFALLPLALIGRAYRYVTGGQVMSTDDAYVNAETVGISTDISGIVQQMDVTAPQAQVALDQVTYHCSASLVGAGGV